MVTYMTYVTSKTWDEVRNKSYPDKYEVERDLAEIDRLLQAGHKVTVVIDMNPIPFDMWLFDNVMFGLHPEYKRETIQTSAQLKNDINKKAGEPNTSPKNNKN